MKKYFIILVLPIVSIFASVIMYFSWFQGWLYFYLKHVMATVSHMGYITVGIIAILLYLVAVQLVNWKINKALLVFCYIIYFSILFCLLFGNVLAFVPIGFLLQKRGFFTALLAAGMLIFAVEGAQYIMHVGFFDTGDVFLNVCGIMLGYIIIRVFSKGKFKQLKVKPTS